MKYKKILVPLFATLLIASSIPLKAANLSITSKHREKVVYDEVAPSGSGTITASLPIDYMDPSMLNADTPVSIHIAGFNFNQLLGDAPNYRDGVKSVTFTGKSEDITGDSGGTATLKLSWTVTNLTISATANFDVFSCGDYEDTQGISNPVEIAASISLGDFYIQRTLYGSAKVSIFNTNVDDQDFSLKSVDLNGSADMTAPTVTITAPSARLVVSNSDPIMVYSQASDSDSGVSSVALGVTVDPWMIGYIEMYEDLQNAEFDGTNWSAQITPTPGTNYICVIATDAAGNTSMAVRSIFFDYKSQISLQIVNPTCGSVSGVTNGQWLQEGNPYIATAVSKPGNIFVKWVDSSQNYEGFADIYSKHYFTMTNGLNLTAVFMPTPYTNRTFSGLFFGTNEDITIERAGAIAVSLTANGHYTGKLRMADGLHSFQGQFSVFNEEAQTAEDNIYVLIHQGSRYIPSEYVGLHLVLTLGELSQLSGEVSSTDYDENFYPLWVSPLNASPIRVTAKNPDRGTFNTVLKPQSEGVGYGYGITTVDVHGGVTMSFHLPGGTAALLAGASQNIDGTIPVFASMYNKKGLLIGWLGIGEGEIAGENLVWIKPPTNTRGALYPDGFTESLITIGAKWVAPRSTSSLVSWTAGTVELSDAILETSISEPFSFAKGKFRALDENPDKVSVSVSGSGSVNGSFKFNGAAKSVTFKGILLQNSGEAYGFYTLSNRTASFRMSDESNY